MIREIRTTTVALVFTLLGGMGGGLGQDRSSRPVPNMGEVRFASLPVVVGLFDHLDQENEKLYVSLDKERKKLEVIELGRVRAVYLIQGNREKLLNYLVGGAGGGALGLSGLFMKNKFLVDKNATAPTSLEPGEATLWTSVGAGIGLVVGWLKGRGVEDVRAFPIYDLEIVSDPASSGKRDLRDKKNIGRVIPGTMIQVVTGSPEG